MKKNGKDVCVQIIGENVYRKPGEPDINQTVNFSRVTSTLDLQIRIHNWNVNNQIAIRSIKIVDDVSK
jgi:hypothetical protein